MSVEISRTLANSNGDAVKVISEMVKEHIGINTSVRCIVADDGDSEVFAKDTMEILKCLDIKHPVAVHLVNVCQGHKDVYGCGVKSMLFMVGHLCSQVKELLEQGIPLFCIEELLHEAVEDCISHLQPVIIPVTVTSLLQKYCESQPGFPDHQTDQSQVAPLTNSIHHCSRGFEPSTELRDTTQSLNETNSVTSCITISGCDSNEIRAPQTKKKEFQNQSCKARTCKLGSFDDGVKGDFLQGKTVVPDLHTSHQASSNMAQKLKSSEFISSHPSHAICDMNLNSSSQTSLLNLNNFLQHHKKSAVSTNLCDRMMINSRHLRYHGSAGDSADGDEVISLSESNDFRNVPEQRNMLSSCLSSIPSCACSTGIECSEITVKCVQETVVSHKSNLSQEYNQICGQVRTQKMPVRGQAILSLPEASPALSHGCNEPMLWAKEVIDCQHQHRRHSRFDINLIHTRCISSLQSSIQLIHGLVVDFDLKWIETATKLSCPVSVLLVNGDLTSEFRHKGYKPAVSVKSVTKKMDSLHMSQYSWHSEVLCLLQQLDVQVVLVRGLVDSSIQDTAIAAGIVLADRVPFQALKVLQTACQVDLVTYILEAHEGNVCTGVSFRPLHEDWCDTLSPDCKHMVITVPVFVQDGVSAHWQSIRATSHHSGPLQEGDFLTDASKPTHDPEAPTLVIGETTAASREIKEEEFWKCIARLVQAVEDTKVLMGGGVTEQFCADLLKLLPSCADKQNARVRWPGELALYRPTVRAVLANAFQAYAFTVKHNRNKAGYNTDDQHDVHMCQNTSLPSMNPHSDKIHCSCHAYESSTPECLLVKGTKSNFKDKPQSLVDHELYLGRCGGLGFVQPQKQNGSEDNSISQVTVCDNFSSKVNGWRSVINCVCTVLRMDSAITTGIEQQNKPSHSILL